MTIKESANMARASTLTAKSKSSTRPAASATRARQPSSTTNPTKVAPQRKLPAGGRPAMLTKGELRAQIVKLETAVEMLRAKAAALRKGARFAAARIAELEGQLGKPAQPEKPSAPSSKPTSTRAARPSKRAVPEAQAHSGSVGETAGSDAGETTQ